MAARVGRRRLVCKPSDVDFRDWNFVSLLFALVSKIILSMRIKTSMRINYNLDATSSEFINCYHRAFSPGE